MRNCPARLTASADCAASITPRDTSPTRKLACIDAARSSENAASSLNCWWRISTPLARSTHLRSSSWASAAARARAWAWRCANSGPARASAERSAASGAPAGSHAITCNGSKAAASAGRPLAPATTTGSGAAAASKPSAASISGASPSPKATTICGASRTPSRTNMWHGTVASTASPAARNCPASAWASACDALLSAWTIKTVIGGRGWLAKGPTITRPLWASRANRTRRSSVPRSVARAHWHECCIAPPVGCNAAPGPSKPAACPAGACHLEPGCRDGVRPAYPPGESALRTGPDQGCLQDRQVDGPPDGPAPVAAPSPRPHTPPPTGCAINPRPAL